MKTFFLMGCMLLIGVSCAQSKGQNTMKSTLILRAAANNDTLSLKKAIANGAQLDLKDNKGRTALMLATYANHVEAAKILIKAGANVNAQDHMLNSPFLYAGAEGFTEIVKICMTANPDYRVLNRYKGTALIPASEHAHLEVIKLLLDDPNYPIDHINRLGWTALLEAIILGEGNQRYQQAVSMLIAAGANVNIADNNGITPLQHAKRRGFKEIAQLLILAGAK